MIRRVLGFGLLAVGLTAVETALLHALGVSSLALHLGLGLVLYLAASADGVEGTAGAALVGWAWDLYSGMPPGLGTFLSVFLFVGARALSQAVDFSGPVLLVLGAAAEATFSVGVLALLGLAGALGPVHLGAVLGPLAWQVVLAALFVPPVYALARRVDRWLGVEASDAGEVWLK